MRPIIKRQRDRLSGVWRQMGHKLVFFSGKTRKKRRPRMKRRGKVAGEGGGHERATPAEKATKSFGRKHGAESDQNGESDKESLQSASGNDLRDRVRLRRFF